MYCMRYIVYETKLSNDESLTCVSLLHIASKNDTRLRWCYMGVFYVLTQVLSSSLQVVIRELMQFCNNIQLHVYCKFIQFVNVPEITQRSVQSTRQNRLKDVDSVDSF